MLMVMNQMTTEALAAGWGCALSWAFQSHPVRWETMTMSLLQMRELRLSPWLSGGSEAGSPDRWRRRLTVECSAWQNRCQQGPREAWRHARVNVDPVGSAEGTMLAASVLFPYAVCVCVSGGAGKPSFPSQSSYNCVTSSELGLPSPPAWVNLPPPL